MSFIFINLFCSLIVSSGALMVLLWFNVDHIGELLKDTQVMKWLAHWEVLDYYLNCPVCQSVALVIILSLGYNIHFGMLPNFWVNTPVSLFLTRLGINWLILKE